MKTLRTTLLGMILFGVLSVNSVTGQCVQEPIQTKGVEGFLVFGWNGMYRTVENARVQLLDVHNQKHVLASANVNPDGYFQLSNLKPGKYILRGETDDSIPAYVEVTIKKSMSKPDSNFILFISLAADAREECGGSSITLRSRESVDRILTEARRKERSRGNR